jgi:hypothetical protein
MHSLSEPFAMVARSPAEPLPPASRGLYGRMILVATITLLARCGVAKAATPLFPLTLDAAEAVRATPALVAGSNSREGYLGLLDSRSIYGKDWFPEPLRADEADVDNEVAFKHFHSEQRHAQTDEASAEFEKSFGLLTLEIAGGYESNRSMVFNPDSNMYERDDEKGFTNIELGARHPIFQWVSTDGRFDNTVVFGLEVSPPTRTQVSHDTEIVPKFFDLLKVGDHLSVQTGLGVSTLIGPEAGGQSTLEYDVVLGYELSREVLPLPWVVSTIPMFELDGETTLNKADAGHNILSGTVGFRLNFESIGPIQPKLGLGYAFPIDQGGREDFRWGIVTSLIFEY